MNASRHPVPPSRWPSALLVLLLAVGLAPAPAHARPPVAVAAVNPASISAVNVPIRPDPKLTPGDTLDVTLADIQERGYSARVRNVPVAVKRQVYAAYGIAHWNKGEYEVDHLVPLSLGGSNSTRNLWPQSYQSRPWNAHVKDALEYRLLTLVRAGKVDMKTAQAEIARDWIAAYQRYVGPAPKAGQSATPFRPSAPGTSTSTVGKAGGRTVGDFMAADGQPDLDAGSTTATTPDANQGVPKGSDTSAATMASSGSSAQQVWVNTRSRVYHRASSRFYGKTKEGKYLTEAEALAAGFHAAPNHD